MNEKYRTLAGFVNTPTISPTALTTKLMPPRKAERKSDGGWYFGILARSGPDVLRMQRDAARDEDPAAAVLSSEYVRLYTNRMGIKSTVRIEASIFSSVGQLLNNGGNIAHDIAKAEDMKMIKRKDICT